MDRETLAARLYARPRVALDPDSTQGLDIPRPAEAIPTKCDGFGSRAVVAMAQEAHAQTTACLGIWHELARIADALESIAIDARQHTPTQQGPA